MPDYAASQVTSLVITAFSVILFGIIRLSCSGLGQEASSRKRFFQFAASLLLTAGLLACLATPSFAQYTVTNLVSNQNAIGSNPADPDLVNAWGVTSLAASPFWVSDNGTGKSTLYNSLGQKQGLVVTIPSFTHSFVASLFRGY